MKKKKLLIIILLIAIAGGAALYFLVLRGGSGKAKKEILYSYVPGDYFVTNVKDSDKLFKVTVVLMLNTDKLNDQLDKNKYAIRDTILFTLRSLTEEDILNPDIQDTLRKDLTTKLNASLGIDNIVTICFSDFAMS